MNPDEPENNSSPESSDNQNSLESAESSSSLESTQTTGKIVDAPRQKIKAPFLQRVLRKTNVYLLLFILLLILAGVIVLVTWLASKNADKSTVQTQSLTSDTLKQLATTDVTVGQPKQVLNVQSNAVFAGKVLIRDSLEVAGAIQVGGALNVPGITVSGNSIFESIQVNKDLSVAGSTALQGQVSVLKNLSVGGTATFGGNISAPQVTTNNLQLNGNLTLTKHIAVGGATPSRSTGSAVGGGGTVALSGSDIGGSININTGTNPGAGCFVTINFILKYNTTPRVNVTPIGSSAANVGYYVDRSTSSFSVCAANTPPTNASFGFDYFIVE